MALNNPTILLGRIGLRPLGRGAYPPELQRIRQNLDQVFGMFTGAVLDLLAA